MPLSDTFKKLKDKLEGKSSEKSDHGTTSGSTTRGTASPRLSSDKASSSSVVAPYEGQATKEKTPSRLSESHTPLTTAIGRIGTKSSDKNKTKSGLHGILAGGEKSGYATPNPNSKNALKQKRRKAKKEQRKKEVEERRLRGEMGGKRSKMNRRAQPKSKYRNETFGFYPLMTSDPDQHESELQTSSYSFSIDYSHASCHQNSTTRTCLNYPRMTWARQSPFEPGLIESGPMVSFFFPFAVCRATLGSFIHGRPEPGLCRAEVPNGYHVRRSQVSSRPDPSSKTEH